jgi:hypothetical protein
MRVLNVELMSNPLNWIIVFAVAIFWLMALAIISPQSTP